MIKTWRAALAATFGLAALGAFAAEQQGVSKGEIERVNRKFARVEQVKKFFLLETQLTADDEELTPTMKLKLLVEDSGYDPKKAVLAAQKLVNQDKIFIMIGHIGTAQNNAAMPVQFEKNVINFFPITAAREMYEPFPVSYTHLRAHET